MNPSSILLILAGVAQLGASPSSTPYPSDPSTSDPVFKSARITSDYDRILSAEVEGVLTQLSVKEGARLKKGELYATIDDRQAQAAVEIAENAHEAAIERAEDKVEETFARASAEYAKVDLLKDQMANQDKANAVPEIQILQKKLALKRAQLQIEKAQKDRLIAGKEANVKEAELRAAQIALDHRTLRAPFDGEVQELVQKEAQWVNPGDPILRLVKFDVLRVETMVQASEFDPIELAGRAVTVRVPLARNREVSVQGKIVHVGQTVEPIRGNYLVRAEIENQRHGEFWLIRPGMLAEMTIHTSQPPVDEPAKSAARP